jgi:hypothetical protein
MKIILAIFFTLLISFTAQSQHELELTFKKYQNNTNATSIVFDDNIMSYLKNKDKDFNTNIEKVEILLFTPDQNLSESDQNKINRAIDADNYDLLVNAKTKEGKAKMYGLSENDDVLKVLYAQVKSDHAHIYFLLKGNIHFEELAEMGLNFEGADVFKMLNGTAKDFEQKKEDKN